MTVRRERINSEEIDVADPYYLIPNVFTPNGDTRNEKWTLGEFFIGSEVIILNRAGRRVFESKSYQNNFDGNNFSAGVYYYLVKSSCLSEPIKGPLTIIY